MNWDSQKIRISVSDLTEMRDHANKLSLQGRRQTRGFFLSAMGWNLAVRRLGFRRTRKNKVLLGLIAQNQMAEAVHLYDSMSTNAKLMVSPSIARSLFEFRGRPSGQAAG